MGIAQYVNTWKKPENGFLNQCRIKISVDMLPKMSSISSYKPTYTNFLYIKTDNKVLEIKIFVWVGIHEKRRGINPGIKETPNRIETEGLFWSDLQDVSILQ